MAVRSKDIEKPKKAKRLSEKNLFSSCSQKHRDHMMLLLSDERFQKRIREIRKNLSIPEEGFPSDASRKGWLGELAKKADEITNNPEFIKKQEKIRESFRLKKITLDEATVQSKELNLEIPFNYKTHAIKSILKDFNTPEEYAFYMQQYLVSNRMIYPANSFTIGPYTEGNPLLDVRYVPIRIYAKLTDEDLKQLKLEVNNFHGKNLPSLQKIKNLEKKLEVERLLGSSEEDIVEKQTYKLTAKDVAERVYKSSKKQKGVYLVRQALKRLRKRRFGYL